MKQVQSTYASNDTGLIGLIQFEVLGSDGQPRCFCTSFQGGSPIPVRTWIGFMEIANGLSVFYFTH